MRRFVPQERTGVRNNRLPNDIAVIDTNVLVSALITHNPAAATAGVVRLLLEQGFIPMYDDDIIAEYEDVLSPAQFLEVCKQQGDKRGTHAL